MALARVFLLLPLLGLGDAVPASIPSNAFTTTSTWTPQPSYADYAPIRVQCPNGPMVRPASEGISKQEASWVEGRKAVVVDALYTYLTGLELQDFDVSAYVQRLRHNSSSAPNIGFAISGGGWASAFTGAGALRALDARYGPALQQRTGGLLQSMTYISGLSGGSWPVMSLATDNFPTIDEMVASWKVDVNRFDANDFEKYLEQVYPKWAEGYQVGILETLARAFGYQFLPGPDGGMGVSVSNIPATSNFADYQMPFPLWQSSSGSSDDIEYDGVKVPYFNATIYEFNPFEFGAWNGPSQFFPTEYLGTAMLDGKPAGNYCITGFDRASFVMGASADAVNFWLLGDETNNTEGVFQKRRASESPTLSKRLVNFPYGTVKELINAYQEFFHEPQNVSLFLTVPDPFAQNKTDLAHPANITLIDESEAYQALPLWTLAQPAREPDLLIAWDNGEEAGSYSWNNGSNLYATYNYAKDNDVPFPVVPDWETFVNKGYASSPVFFGCEANLTSTKDLRAPIVLYLASAPYSTFANFTWDAGVYSNESMATIMTNSWNIVTQGNGTLDSEWAACLGCAAIDRSLNRLSMVRTAQCQACMTKYCWDGTVDNTPTASNLDLPLRLDPNYTYAQWNKTSNETWWAEVNRWGIRAEGAGRRCGSIRSDKRWQIAAFLYLLAFHHFARGLHDFEHS